MLHTFSSVKSRPQNLRPILGLIWGILGLGTLGAISSPQAYSDVAVPGKSVGKIRLGDTRSAVLNRLGKPSKSTKWKSGPTQDTWLGPKPPVDQDGIEKFRRIELNVIYRAGVVVQIEFNSPSFVTAQGISIKSNLRQFRTAYAGVKPTAYAYLDPGGGGYVGYYFDSRSKGIAFSFGTQDYFDFRITPELLRVHRAGYPVLADPGGQSKPATDEVPDTQKMG